MTREDYERYAAAFNERDYDAVFDFYADNPRLAFFGIEITTREELRAFYTFLHRFVRETITIERFASSDELAAVEGVVRMKGSRISAARRSTPTACRPSSRSRRAKCKSCGNTSTTT